MRQEAKMRFGWDVATLDPYVDQESMELVADAVLAAETVSLISVETDVKFKKKLKGISAPVNWSTGGACGFTPDEDNTVDLTDREIETSAIKYEMPFCNLDLLGTWGQKALRAGAVASLQELPYQQLIQDHLLSVNALELEKAVWNGNTATGTGNLAFFDGLEAVITAASASCIDINTAGATTFTSANAYDVMWAAYTDMAASDTGKAVLERGAIAWLTRTQYLALIKNITDLNLFHFDSTAAAAGRTFVLPGTDLEVRQINGRSVETKFYIAEPMNLVFGTDLMADTMNLKLWYNEDEEQLRFRLRMRAGTQIRKPSEIGYFVLA